MARRRRQRSVSRLLLLTLAVTTALAVVWSVLGARRMAGEIAQALIEETLVTKSDQIAGHVRENLDLLGPERINEVLDLTGLARAAVFRLNSAGRMSCLAAHDRTWIGREARTIPQTAGPPERPRIVQSESFLDLMDRADGRAVDSPEVGLLERAQRLDEGTVVYTAISTALVTEARRAATWDTLWRAILICAVVGGLVWLVLEVRLAAPLRRLAHGAEAMAAQRTATKLALEGPDEIANLGVAIGALATESQAERQRAETEAKRWRSLFDEIPAPAYILAGDERVLEANRQALDLLKTDLASLRQRRRPDFTQPDGSLELPGGETMPVHWVEAPTEHEGRPALLAVGLDLRTLRSAEATLTHLARVLDSVDTMVLELGPDGRVIACNQEVLRLLGRRTAQVQGQTLAELFEGDPPPPVWAEVTATVRDGEAWEGEVSLRTRSGATREYALRISPFTGPAGDRPGYLALAHDITEHRRLARDLHHTESLGQLGAVAGGIAREVHLGLRAMMAILGHLKTLAGHQTELLEGLRALEVTLRRASESGRRMCEYARDRVLTIAPADVNLLIQQAAAAPEAMAARRVTVTVEVDEELPEVPVDAEALSEALRAIISNSLEAMAGGGTLRIKTALGGGPAEGGPRVHIQVADTGRGMDAPTLRHATEPLFSTRQGAEGLGLTAAAGLIHLLGGDLHMASTPGQGTVIDISLPITQEEQEQSHRMHDHAETPLEFPPASLIPREEAEDILEGLADDPASEHMERPEQEELSFAPEELEDGTEGQDDEERLEGETQAEEDESEMSDEEDALEEESETGDSRRPRGEAGTPALLLVDDEEIVLELVCDIFENEPFDILTATSGAEALEVVEEEGGRIFMAVVDLTMPEMDGWETARVLAGRCPGIPVHLASGYDTREEDIPADCRGAVAGLIRKPFRAGLLRDLIESELAKRA